MQELKIVSTSITEPVLVADVKAYMGFPTTDTTQDTLLEFMISAARQWVEDQSGVSCVEKDYKAYFEKQHSYNGWYDLPVAPVVEITKVSVCGTEVTYQQKGLEQVSIKPNAIVSTSTAFDTYYLEVEFSAGAANPTANQLIIDIVDQMFNNRGSAPSVASLSYSSLRLLQSLSLNNGI